MLRFFKKGLKKTHEKLVTGLNKVVSSWGTELDEDLLEELEQILVETDIGVENALEIIDKIRSLKVAKADPDNIYKLIEENILETLGKGKSDIVLKDGNSPKVILFIGVNGTGKTTTLAKMANQLKNQGNRVIIAACDTFRAAAVEQLKIWASRVNVDIVQHGQDADASAVAFDAAEAAVARGADYLLVDTAGRFHTRVNLLEELKKIRRVLAKKIPGAPHETLLVLDATTGQNALHQAETFEKELSLTGLVLTKIDGTAKGGIVVSIMKKLDVPVKFVGLGESLEDLQPFNPKEYVQALLEH
ncbi:MAG: signal recognition particle-docking protein FtsY [Candidatus Theseobacter exili]|nr:signal recognition particle-docking protein FtsY [Candidatus Theseobacter exili]